MTVIPFPVRGMEPKMSKRQAIDHARAAIWISIYAFVLGEVGLVAWAIWSLI